MLGEKAPAYKFRQHSLSKLVGVQVSRLFHQAQAFCRSCRRNDPSHAKTGEGNFGEAVNVNDDVGAIELLEGRNTLFPVIQPGINVVFDNRHLVPRRDFENLAPRGKWNRSPCRILKVWCEYHQLDAISGKRSFERFQVNAQRTARFGVRLDWNAEATSAGTIEDCNSTGISRIFENDRVTRPNERFADQIQRLLAAIRDKQIFVPRGNAFLTENLQQGFLQRGITVGGPQIQDFSGFAAQ